MMTQQLQASIVTAPLAQIDRRALSQAWYSALRLAHGQTKPMPPPRARTSTAAVSQRAIAIPERARFERAVRRSALPLRAVSKRPDSTIAGGERRAPSATLGQRIARAVLAPGTLPVRSTLTLGRGEGRVHVILQSSGGRMRLIAICRPADREVVARALAQARLTLAVSGCELETQTGAFACS